MHDHTVRAGSGSRAARLWWGVLLAAWLALAPAFAGSVVALLQLPAQDYTVQPGDSAAGLAWRMLGSAGCEHDVARWAVFSGARWEIGATFRARPVQLTVRTADGDTWASLAVQFRGVTGPDAAAWLAKANQGSPDAHLEEGTLIVVPPAIGAELVASGGGDGSTLTKVMLRGPVQPAAAPDATNLTSAERVSALLQRIAESHSGVPASEPAPSILAGSRPAAPAAVPATGADALGAATRRSVELASGLVALAADQEELTKKVTALAAAESSRIAAAQTVAAASEATPGNAPGGSGAPDAATRSILLAARARLTLANPGTPPESAPAVDRADAEGTWKSLASLPAPARDGVAASGASEVESGRENRPAALASTRNIRALFAPFEPALPETRDAAPRRTPVALAGTGLGMEADPLAAILIQGDHVKFTGVDAIETTGDEDGAIHETSPRVASAVWANVDHTEDALALDAGHRLSVALRESSYTGALRSVSTASPMGSFLPSAAELAAADELAVPQPARPVPGSDWSIRTEEGAPAGDSADEDDEADTYPDAPVSIERGHIESEDGAMIAGEAKARTRSESEEREPAGSAEAGESSIDRALYQTSSTPAESSAAPAASVKVAAPEPPDPLTSQLEVARQRIARLRSARGQPASAPVVPPSTATSGTATPVRAVSSVDTEPATVVGKLRSLIAGYRPHPLAAGQGSVVAASAPVVARAPEVGPSTAEAATANARRPALATLLATEAGGRHRVRSPEHVEEDLQELVDMLKAGRPQAAQAEVSSFTSHAKS